MSARITRIVELFSEGRTVLLGYDTAVKPIEPIVVWVNKLNAFETQEARADGAARRSEAMISLSAEDAPERGGFMAEISVMNPDQLADQYCEAFADDIYLSVVNDIESDPDWRERRDRIERLPHILDDAKAADDDPRRKQLADDQIAWVTALREGQTAKIHERREEALALDRDELIAILWERYRQRQTMEVFMAERRVTALFFALRECNATDLSTTPEKHEWDHSRCEHTKRLVDDRAEIRDLPDEVIAKCEDALDDMAISPRAAGNSDAPASSSASSEPASAEAAASTPSTPAATSPEPPTS